MKWKNWLIRAILWIFSPEATRPKHDKTPSRFLIVSTTGLGDTLWGTPAIRALRQSYPEAHIVILTSEVGHQILKHNKHIDEVFVIDSSCFSLFRYFFTLKKRNFDAILLFHSSQRIILPFCALLEADEIVGSEGINKDLDFLLTKPLKQKYQHEISRRLEIVKTVGARITEMSLEMPVRKDEEKVAAHFLEGHGIADHIPIIGLHPGAKNTFKQWPIEGFIKVGKQLTQHLGCQIMVSGDESEALLVLEIASKIPGAIPIAGELGIAPFTALLKKMGLFITNDTGPMHLAFSVGTPTVAIFGPTDPSLCGPFHVEKVKVLAAKKTCSPCLKKRCEDPFCLRQIGPANVYQAAIDLFYQTAALKEESLIY